MRDVLEEFVAFLSAFSYIALECCFMHSGYGIVHGVYESLWKVQEA